MLKYYKGYRFVNLDKSLTRPDEVSEVKRIIGSELRSFIANKFGTLKKAASALDCTPPYLSRAINGRIKLSKRIQLKLIDFGFDETSFYNYVSTKDAEDLPSKMLIYELKRLIDRQDLLLKAYQKAIIELREDFDRIRKINPAG